MDVLCVTHSPTTLSSEGGSSVSIMVKWKERAVALVGCRKASGVMTEQQKMDTPSPTSNSTQILRWIQLGASMHVLCQGLESSPMYSKAKAPSAAAGSWGALERMKSPELR